MLAIMHTLHNNFLVNLRLMVLEKNPEALWIWTPLNKCICKLGRGDQMNGMQYFCRDRCLKPQTVVKAVLYAVVFFIVASNVTSSHAKLMADYEKIKGEKPPE